MTESGSGAMVALHAALDELEAQVVSCLDADALEHETVQALRARERVTALASKLVAEADRSGLAARQASIASTTALLAAHTRGPTRAIAPWRSLGLWLTGFAVLADAWAAGTLTEAHIRELKGIDNPRTRLALIRDQQVHVDNAQRLDFAAWLSSVAYWVLHADPDGSLPNDSEASYGLRLRTDRRGDVHVNGILDPLAGEALMTMVEHEADNIRRHQIADGAEPIDQYPTRQRNALALLRLTKRGYQRPDGGWPTPLVTIVMSQTVAEDLVSRMLDGDTHDPFELPLDYHDIDRRCETIRGTPLDPRRAWPALITGWLRRQIINAKTRKMNVGHDVRLFNAAQKLALLVEARGQCSTVGCDAPFTWLEADHTHPTSRQGQTNLDNGQIKCGPDNHRKADHLTDHNDRIIDETDPTVDSGGEPS